MEKELVRLKMRKGKVAEELIYGVDKGEVNIAASSMVKSS